MVRQEPQLTLLTVFFCHALPSVLGVWSMALVLWLLYELSVCLLVCLSEGKCLSYQHPHTHILRYHSVHSVFVMEESLLKSSCHFVHDRKAVPHSHYILMCIMSWKLISVVKHSQNKCTHDSVSSSSGGKRVV